MSDLASFIVELSSYNFLSEIYSNKIIKVYLVEDKKTKKKYAAKVYFHDTADIKEQISLIREAELLSKVTHPAIIGFSGFSLVDNNRQHNPVILTEYQVNGSLQNVIDALDNNKVKSNISDEKQRIYTELRSKFNNTKRLIIILGIASSMQYIHHRDLIHRDLKPDSILIDENLYPHLGGFGLCTVYNPEEMKDDTAGTMIYMAPELLGDGKSNFSNDVYSFAIILYQLLGFGHPYGGVTDPFEIAKRVSKGERPQIPSDANPHWASLIQSCWDEDPLERPSFPHIVETLCTEEGLMLENVDRDEYEKYKFLMISSTFSRL